MQLDTASHEWSHLIRAMSLQPGPDASQTVDNGPHNPLKSQIARAITGCNHARAGLLREIEDPCYRFCLSLLTNPDAARDATQETALRVLRSLARYRGDAAFTTWALSIALNVCREHRRRRRWAGLPLGWSSADPAPGPHAQADASEQSDRLRQAIEGLPPRQQEAVTLRYLQGLSTKQTAQAMRCAEGTVKATLAKALKALRKQWGQDDV
ncbi:MAG: sigma-70 family RNA polymerase sigma factor [Firmicutes bacterium]|nr:sigma-70 family RNA polymerase sigma factor [Bacillota bacterium]